jgi:hypothetical protein
MLCNPIPLLLKTPLPLLRARHLIQSPQETIEKRLQPEEPIGRHPGGKNRKKKRVVKFGNIVVERKRDHEDHVQ